MNRRDPFEQEPINEIQKLVEERTKPKPKRKKNQPKRDRSWDAGRVRGIYDTTQETKDHIKEIAEELGLKEWEAHEYLIREAIRLHRAGEIAPELRPVRYGIVPE